MYSCSAVLIIYRIYICTLLWAIIGGVYISILLSFTADDIMFEDDDDFDLSEEVRRMLYFYYMCCFLIQILNHM